MSYESHFEQTAFRSNICVTYLIENAQDQHGKSRKEDVIGGDEERIEDGLESNQDRMRISIMASST